ADSGRVQERECTRNSPLPILVRFGTIQWKVPMENIMTAVLTPVTASSTLADLLRQLGDIAPGRVRFPPALGQASEQDVLDIERREDRLCELVDGVLVEKAMGYRESLLAVEIVSLLLAFVKPRNLGLVSGEAGMMRLFPGLVRIPDAAFVSWNRIPKRRVPSQ